MPFSPLLKSADNATAFYDHRLGKWRTKIGHGNGRLVTLCSHGTEAEARQWIGLEGGSTNPCHVPPVGRTGIVTLTPQQLRIFKLELREGGIPEDSIA